MWLHTNESLESIIVGLAPTRTDKVLTICGSGEQAFALAPHYAQVVVIDKDVNQLRYASQRLANLRNKNVAGFLNAQNQNNVQTLKLDSTAIDPDGTRYPQTTYFTAQRIGEILQAYPRIDIIRQPNTVLEYVQEHGHLFTHFYFSNVVGLGRVPPKKWIRLFQDLAEKVPSGARAYAVFGMVNACPFGTIHPQPELCYINTKSSWKLDIDATIRAKEAQTPINRQWMPLVLRNEK